MLPPSLHGGTCSSAGTSSPPTQGRAAEAGGPSDPSLEPPELGSCVLLGDSGGTGIVRVTEAQGGCVLYEAESSPELQEKL